MGTITQSSERRIDVRGGTSRAAEHLVRIVLLTGAFVIAWALVYTA